MLRITLSLKGEGHITDSALIVLGIDCSGTSAALALITDGEVQAKEIIDLQQANAIFQLYDDMAIGAVDAIGVTTGPGSFTGIRIGLAFAEGLALANNTPVFGLTSFAAAYAGHAGAATVILESKRAELYVQQFDENGEGATPTMRLAADIPPTAHILSNVAAIMPQPNVTAITMAIAAAQHAYQAFQNRQPHAPALPTYVRPPDAKPNVTAATAL